MNRKITSLLTIFFLVITTINIANAINIKSTQNIIVTIYVDDDNIAGPWQGTQSKPYQYIQQAIENSSKDDIIYVNNGTYKENIEINKEIKIIGEDKSNTIINGEYQGDIIRINSANTTIQGFTIKNSKGENHNAGIKIYSDQVTISDCIIFRTRHGILFNNSENSKIINSLIHTNGEGIYFDNCKNCEIIGSELCHNAIGVHIGESEDINVKQSYFHEDGIGLFINYSYNVKIIDTAICDNNNNQGGSFIFNSKNILIYNSNIIHNGLAIRLDDSEDVRIEKSTFKYNAHYSVLIKRNDYNITVTKCDIVDNLRYGIFVNNGECTAKYNNLVNNYIDSVHLNKEKCDARLNYWGSKYGPFLNGVKIVDILRRGTGIPKLFPWLVKPVINTGSDWDVEDIFTKTQIDDYGDEEPINLPGDDSDSDGLPDWWETKWGYNPLEYDDHANIDEDGDALNNFEECYTSDYGSSPFQKDVFIEVDWIKTGRTTGIKNKPTQEYVNEMIQRFAEHNINLHMDLGNLDGGEEIPYQERFNYDSLIDIYWSYFLHNDLNNPRKNIFHYALVCDTGASTGFEFMGWAHCNAVCISSEILKLVYPSFSYEWLIIVGIMHEIGHTFGLFSDDFNGNDNRGAIQPYYKDFWIYNDYKSVMNYRYFLYILDYSDGDNGENDFDDWSNLDYDFFKNTDFNWPLE